MNLIEGNIYHVYNKANRDELVFFEEENYLYFLRKVHKYLLPCCDILAWCLMPNHFHFLVYATENSTITIKDGGFERQQFSQNIKLLLSSYTKAINKRTGTIGSLFKQKTRAKCVMDKENYVIRTFHYIHQNPLRARLVEKMEDWQYSSFIDYCGKRNGKICNMKLAKEYIDINNDFFYEESYKMINEDLLREIE